MVLAAGVLAFLMVSGHFFPTPVLSRVLVPVFGFLAVSRPRGGCRRVTPTNRGWAILVLALLVKRVRVDPPVPHARELLRRRRRRQRVRPTAGGSRTSGWTRDRGAGAQLDNIRKTNFLRWFTGVVYYLFGTDMIAGFIVFGLIAFVGSYLWYRATVEAVPFLDRRLYFLIVMFVPSILFWPSSIGKEALMQFAIGSAALGTAHIFNGKIVRGVLVAHRRARG